jgi:cystathionine beta-lyase
LSRYGIETTYYDPCIGAGIETLFRPNTKAVFCESPGSLTFEVQDVPAIAAVAHARGASVLIDNTWATPLYFDAFAHGADLSIQAATKYVGGHADVMLGYVCANDSHAARLAQTHDQLGIYASGDDCFLALRGLRTMPVRLKRHGETALALARWLQQRPEVSQALYPALESDPGHALWKRDFSGATGLFGVVLKPIPQAFRDGFFVGRLRKPDRTFQTPPHRQQMRFRRPSRPHSRRIGGSGRPQIRSRSRLCSYEDKERGFS